MKVLPFKIPKPDNELIRHQVDHVSHFYDKLHQHPEVQLTLIISSEGSLVVGDYVGRFAPGEIYLLGSRVPHVFRNTRDYYKDEPKKLAHSESLFFDLSVMESGFSSIKEFEGVMNWLQNLEGCYRVPDSNHFIGDRIKKTRNLAGLARVTACFEILIRLMEEANLERLNTAGTIKNFSQREGKRMENVMRYIMENCHRHISLSEVAGIANMNREAFCRFFKERTRKTATQFINEVRITRACSLLANQDLSISQVAAESGFPNLSYFNRVFRNIKKSTPREYRIVYHLETARRG